MRKQSMMLLFFLFIVVLPGFSDVINREPNEDEKQAVYALILEGNVYKNRLNENLKLKKKAEEKGDNHIARAAQNEANRNKGMAEKKFNEAIQLIIKIYKMDIRGVKDGPSFAWGDIGGYCECDQTVRICTRAFEALDVGLLATTLKHEITHANQRANKRFVIDLDKNIRQAYCRREVEAYDANLSCAQTTKISNLDKCDFAAWKSVYAKQYQAAEESYPPSPYESVQAKMDSARALRDSLMTGKIKIKKVIDAAHKLLANSNPRPERGGVVPEDGNEDEDFMYTVVYTDPDNDPPYFIDVWIDNQAYPMEKVNPADHDYTDGCMYHYKTSLSPGEHSHYFQMSDWIGYARYPAEGANHGPSVKKISDMPDIRQFIFGMRVESKYRSWALNDFGISKKTYKRYNEVEGWTASSKHFSGSIGYSPKVFTGLHISPYHVIGLCTGYEIFPGGSYSQSFSDRDVYSSTITLDLSTRLIPVEIFYKIQWIGIPFSLEFAGGLESYQANINFNWTYLQNGMHGFLRGELKDAGLGYRFSLGGEYVPHRSIAFYIKVGYHFASLNRFTGFLIDQDGHRQKMLLAMINEPGFGESLWTVFKDEPLPPTSRPAEVDFYGWHVTLGICFSLTKSASQK